MILIHDGLAGMKHGQRRWRNYDGTLTEEGKKRYDYYQNKTNRVYKSRSDKAQEPKKYVKTGKWGVKKEDLSGYSNRELKALIERANLEKAYTEAYNAYQYSRGRRFVNFIKNTANEASNFISSGAKLFKSINDARIQAKVSTDITTGKWQKYYYNKNDKRDKKDKKDKDED